MVIPVKFAGVQLGHHKMKHAKYDGRIVFLAPLGSERRKDEMVNFKLINTMIILKVISNYFKDDVLLT